jgi:hypothetical protein
MLGRPTLITITLALLASCGVASAASVDYFNYEHFGGTWYDVEKSPTNPNDNNMCWAAASSTILTWTGWGNPCSTNADTIFSYFVNHWTDQGGIMEYAWDWWFDGTNTVQGWSGWAQVDVPGGGFWNGKYDFYEYYQRSAVDDLVLAAIDQYLNAGYGVALGLYGPGGHSVSCWGYTYDSDTGNYLGVWITDSDDDKSLTNPPDRLRYYSVTETSGKWYLQNFYGSNSWYIGEVQALAQCPVPEPAAVIAAALGVFSLACLARRIRR